MKWQIRRLFLGDRRKADRVILETKNALQKLDKALLGLKMATYEQQRDQNE